MIVVVGGIKGGSGKTTIATNLAVLRSAAGRKVLLIDADEQRSVSDWVEQREALEIPTAWTTIQLAGKTVHAQVLKLAQNYDDVIVDVGGRDTTSQRSALAIADIVVIPFKPRSLDIWTLGSVKTLLSQMKAVNSKLRAFAVINQADVKGNDHLDAFEVLKECDDLECVQCPIVHRKAFSNASADGLGVSELKTQDKKALAEMQYLYDSIYSDAKILANMS